jgi:hypothetical protein
VPTFHAAEGAHLLVSQLDRAGAVPLLEYLAARGWSPTVFAGAVRDVFASLEWGVDLYAPRDFDLAVTGCSAYEFRSTLSALGAVRNRYGGFRLLLRGAPPFDIWRMRDTCGVRLHGVPASVTNVLRSFVLNVNAIAYDYCNREFTDLGCVSALRSKRLNVVENTLLHDHDVFAAKAILLVARFELEAAPALRDFTRVHSRVAALNHEIGKMRETTRSPRASIREGVKAVLRLLGSQPSNRTPGH